MHFTPMTQNEFNLNDTERFVPLHYNDLFTLDRADDIIRIFYLRGGQSTMVTDYRYAFALHEQNNIS